jgi:hypothetical protein
VFGQEEDPVHIILKCSDTKRKLWSEIYIKNEWGSFGNEILMKDANIRNKGTLKRMGEFCLQCVRKERAMYKL